MQPQRIKTMSFKEVAVEVTGISAVNKTYGYRCWCWDDWLVGTSELAWAEGGLLLILTVIARSRRAEA